MAHLNGVPLPSPTGSIPDPSTCTVTIPAPNWSGNVLVTFRATSQTDSAEPPGRITWHGVPLFPAPSSEDAGSIEGGHQVRIVMDEPDEPRGHYLCEGCMDAMTDLIVSADQSPTGIEMALCAA